MVPRPAGRRRRLRIALARLWGRIHLPGTWTRAQPGAGLARCVGRAPGRRR